MSKHAREGFCVHYNGILGGDILDKKALRERRCEAGVLYADVTEPGGKFPCAPGYQVTIECPLRVFPTVEQIAESERQINERIAEMGRRMEAHECIVCGAKIEHYKEVRPCVYAEPCGHRQYQGRAPKQASR